MTTPAPPRLAFDAVTVRFGVQIALASLSVTFAPGRIIGLLGHNGAGKSTMLNAATGAVSLASGSVSVDGVPLPTGAGPSDFSRAGIGVVHQVPALVGSLSILDNLFLGRAPLSRADSRRRARAALDALGAVGLDMDRRVDTLELGERQIVDIVRSRLAGDLRVLLLDEPTAALGADETERLHTLIRELAADGTTVIYVSHRLPDLLDVCDDYVIIREGRVAAQFTSEGISAAALSRALAPGLKDDEVIAREPGEVSLRVKHPFQLEFRTGEIVGLFGVAAGEQFDLLRALSGDHGEVAAELNGLTYAPHSPAAAIARRVHTVPADRDTDGLVGSLPAVDNVYLPWRGKRRLAPDAQTSRGVRESYAHARAALNVVGPDGGTPISSFSGGNRQKHLLAAWMFPSAPSVLLLMQPTQGVDIAAKADIRRALRELAARGTTVVIASAESDEIASIADRAVILAHGRALHVDRDDRFEERLLGGLMHAADQTESHRS